MTTLTTLDILKKGRELIADPARWTQRAMSRDTAGRSFIGVNDRSVYFCSVGAVIKVCGGNYFGHYEDALDALDEQTTGLEMSMGRFNDTHTHAEVLAAWDRAIAAEEAKQ